MPQNDNPTSGNPYVKAFYDLMATSKDFTQFLADPAERQGIRQGFTDAVNRGAVAATFGAPVDMANMGLNLGKAAAGYLGNKAGVLLADQMPQLIDNPVGGSEYIGNQLQRFGVVSPNRNALAEGLAGVLPTSPTKSAKAVAAIAGGGVVPGMDLAATVFHGSPHKFDRFDSSKIGTGEGAQVYGSGLYFAESPGVAGQYKASTSANMYETSKGIIRSSDLVDELFKASGDVPKSLESSYRAKANEVVRDLIMGKSAQDIANEIKSSKYGRSYGKLVEAVEKLSPKTAEGSFYSVDLPDPMIARMLDWDKPLAQQPDVLNALQKSKSQTVRKFLENVNTPGQYSGELPSGESLVRHLSMQASGKQIDPKASLTLQKAGIPGIRYLDGGSRSAGQGSSNYVVFPGNENMLRILERNGQALK